MAARFKLLTTLALCALGGCAGGARNDRPAPVALASPDWRTIATEQDRGRIRGWRDAWMRGLAQARASGNGAAVLNEGVLLHPDAALAFADPHPGTYRCRVIKIGAKSAGLLDYVAYPFFQCRIRSENGLLSFAKLSGSQRPLGLLLPATGDRMIFLGTLQLGDETRALQYGRDPDRDMAGILQRIGDNRWRLVFPYPAFESTIDVVELVPDGA